MSDDTARPSATSETDLAPRYLWIRRRMALVVIGLILVFAAAIHRAYLVQMVQGEEFEDRARNQVERALTLRAKRGSIVDRHGISLAVSVEMPSLIANPRLIEKPDEVADKLLPILGDDIDEETLRARLSSDRGFVWIARRVKPEIANAALDLEVPGLDTVPESQRYYPLKDRGGALLGFVGGEDKGLEGLERTYDEQLAGGEYKLDVMKDLWGRRIYTGDRPSFEKLEGKTIALTIDERIQYIAELELSHALKRKRAKSGSVIVSDPITGDILAMTAMRGEVGAFNPNRFREYKPQDWRNRALSDTFEPGSTFKTFVMAGAFDRGLVTPEDEIDVERGRLTIGEYTIKDTHPTRELTVRNVMKFSSNIGAYKLAKQLGRDSFGDYIHRFGFAERSGIDLPGERRGVVHDPSRWPEITLANVAFGQGLTVTHLQMHMAVSSIANGGTLMTPHMVKAVYDRDGKLLEERSPEPRRRVVSEKAARQTTEMLMSVVEHGGTGTNAAMALYRVAGKTGTAQKVSPKTGRYSDWHWTASFVGFVPADEPALAITVVVDEPMYEHSGGKVAAPVFVRIAEQALPLVGPYPTRAARTTSKSEDKPVEAEAAAEPEAPELPEVPTYVNGVVEPPTTADLVPMPSYLGLSMREVVRRSREHKHVVKLEGHGVVQQQWPGPGVYVGADVVVHVRLGGVRPEGEL